MSDGYYDPGGWDTAQGLNENSEKTPLVIFGMDVGSGLPRIRRIGNRWRVSLLGVRLASEPDHDVVCFGDDLDITLRDYIGTIKNKALLTPRGLGIGPDDLALEGGPSCIGPDEDSAKTRKATNPRNEPEEDDTDSREEP